VEQIIIISIVIAALSMIIALVANKRRKRNISIDNENQKVVRDRLSKI
jgi:hypothetical protein